MKALASKLEDDTESLYKVKKLKGIGSLRRLDGNSSVDNRSSNLPSIHRNGVSGNTDAGSPKSDLKINSQVKRNSSQAMSRKWNPNMTNTHELYPTVPRETYLERNKQLS